MVEIGKLYTCSEYHLLVFPTEEIAVAASASVSASESESVRATRAAAAYATTWAANWADWWSKELNCQVSFIPAGQVFCVVEMGGTKNGFRQVHVVAGEAMGWINVADWLNIKELKG